MVVILSLPLPVKNVWYLAYGSNLSHSKFVQDRGIVPLDSVVVSVPGFTLAMESAGVPYQEPSFASVRLLRIDSFRKETELIGTAYLVTPEQYTRIIASEGGGIAYREESVLVEPIEVNDEKEEMNTGSEHRPMKKMFARTLVTVMLRQPAPRPSQRYKNLIVDGASEAHYPAEYQQYLCSLPIYQPATGGYRRIGASLFLSLWIPVMMLMERITKIGIAWKGAKSGEAPAAIIWMVRAVVFALWWHHDHIHAPLWGRGDGLDQDQEEWLVDA